MQTAIDAEYHDVLFYNSVCRFSRGALLEKKVPLLPHVISFLEAIGHLLANLDNASWQTYLDI